MATVVTIVVVGTHTNGSREIVVHLVGQVHLAAIDVLLALYLRVDGVHVGSDYGDGGLGVHLLGCECLLEDGTHDEGIEHGYAFIVFDEATATHNTNHGREGPTVFLIRGEKGWHDGGRGNAFKFLVIESVVTIIHSGVGQIIRDSGSDVAILPGFLEVERQLETFVAPGETSGVRVGGIDVERSATCHHTVECNVIIGVGHQTSCNGRSSETCEGAEGHKKEFSHHNNRLI